MTAGRGAPGRRLLAVTPTAIWAVADGVALRIHHLLEELVADWDVSVIAATPGPDAPGASSPPPGLALADYEAVTLTGRWRSIPSQFDTTPLVTAATRAVARQQPAAMLLWPAAEFLAWTIPGAPHSVADRIDCLALTMWRAARRAAGDPSAGGPVRRGRRLAGALRTTLAVADYERRVVRRTAATVVVGRDDGAALRRLGAPGSAARITVIPNGVAMPASADASSQPARARQPTVLFVGTLNYEPNIAAARELATRIWPAVARALPEARLVIAGRNPTPEVLALAAPPAIAVHANIERMRDAFDAAWVCAAPMVSGSGVKNKVLEGWAHGLPVVMSRLAANGLPIPSGHDRLVTDDPGTAADILVRLLSDPRERAQLGDEARRFVRAAYSWTGAAAQVSALLARQPLA